MNLLRTVKYTAKLCLGGLLIEDIYTKYQKIKFLNRDPENINKKEYYQIMSVLDHIALKISNNVK